MKFLSISIAAAALILLSLHHCDGFQFHHNPRGTTRLHAAAATGSSDAALPAPPPKKRSPRQYSGATSAGTVKVTKGADKRNVSSKYNRRRYPKSGPGGVNRRNNGGRGAPKGRRVDPRQQQQQPPSRPPPVPDRPYQASYQVSLRTQARIKETAARMKRLPDSKRAEAVLSTLLDTPPDQINEVNVVCALTLSAKCMNPNTRVTPELRKVLFQVLDILKGMVERGQLKARQLCNSIYAIAKHYNTDDSILPAQAEATAMSSENMMGVAEAWILQDENENTPEKRLESTIEEIATRLTSSIEGADRRRKPHVGEVSMACWAYGVLRQRVRPPGWTVPPQLSRLPSHLKSRNALKNVQVVTFEQWAVNSDDENERLVIKDPVGKLFDAIGFYLWDDHKDDDGSKMLVEEMSWSEIANVAWAFANHGHCRTEASETLMVTFAQEARHRLRVAREGKHPPFLPRDISQLVWSIGTLQSDNFRLGDDLADLIDATVSYYLDGSENPLKDWSNADLVQLAIALAHGRIDHRPLLRALYQEAHLRVLGDMPQTVNSRTTHASFHEWEVSVLLWVQARLYLKEEDGKEFVNFVRSAPSWLMHRAEGVSSLEELGIGAQEQANLAWSFTVLEEYEAQDTLALLRKIFEEASVGGSKNEYIQLEHAHQLWQALYLMQYECPQAVEHVPDWFRDFLKEKWSVEKARQKISSARHRALSKTLGYMGIAHYNEHDEDIDVAIVLKESSSWTNGADKSDHKTARFKVALEFDGPLHFTREAFDEDGVKIAPRTLGHTALKYRLLKQQGWAVVRVPYYEFDKIPFWASMERQRYLQRLLKTHANIKFSEVDISEYKAITPNRKSRFD